MLSGNEHGDDSSARIPVPTAQIQQQTYFLMGGLLVSNDCLSYEQKGEF